MIALISTCDQGGMLQFATQIYIALCKSGEKAKLVIPATACLNEYMLGKFLSGVHYYNYKKNSPDYPPLRHVLSVMDAQYLLFADATTTSKIAILDFHKKSADITLFIHDAVRHPTHTNIFVTILRNVWHNMLNYFAFNSSNRLVFMSISTQRYFKCLYKHVHEPMLLFPIGSLIQHAEAVRPVECEAAVGSYYLFFGRIDAYKNIALAIRCFLKLEDKSQKLVIAGKGIFSAEEQQLIENNMDRIIVINRYISDAESAYLIENAKCVLLPYKEASQSGVIPIAYSYGTPVISTDLEGLAEFIRDGYTGLLCSNEVEFYNAMCKMLDPEIRMELSKHALAYYCQYLEWEYNTEKLISKIRKEQTND